MTKLRNRLLITLILAAVSLSAIGVGTVSARTRTSVRGARNTTTTTGSTWSFKARTPVGPYSGEPDAGNGTTPKQYSKPTTGSPTDVTVDALDMWMQLWALWLTSR
jgi:hypothetical protein